MPDTCGCTRVCAPVLCAKIARLVTQEEEEQEQQQKGTKRTVSHTLEDERWAETDSGEKEQERKKVQEDGTLAGTKTERF